MAFLCILLGQILRYGNTIQGGPKSKPQATFLSVLPLASVVSRLSSPLLDYPLDGNSFNCFSEPHLFSFLRLSNKILSFTHSHLHARLDGTHYVMHKIFTL